MSALALCLPWVFWGFLPRPLRRLFVSCLYLSCPLVR